MNFEKENLHLEIGVIKNAAFGYGGYQNAMIVFIIEVGAASQTGWGVTKTYVGGWAHRTDSAKWTEEDRIKQLGESAWEVFNLIREAKKNYLHELKGVPIRAYFKYQGSSRLAGEIDHIEIFKEVIHG